MQWMTKLYELLLYILILLIMNVRTTAVINGCLNAVDIALTLADVADNHTTDLLPLVCVTFFSDFLSLLKVGLSFSFSRREARGMLIVRSCVRGAVRHPLSSLLSDKVCYRMGLILIVLQHAIQYSGTHSV